MTRIQAYVLWRTFLGVGAVLAIIASVVALVDFVELSRTIGAQADIGFFTLIELVVLEAPSVILLLLPFVFLFGVMGAFVALNRRSELVAMRAAGVSAWRFVFPAALAAASMGLVTVVALNPIAANLNAQFEDRRAALNQEGNPRQRPEIWLRQQDNGRQMVIHARTHDTLKGAIRLRNVSLFIQDTGPDGALNASRRLEAEEAILTPGFWRLRNVREALPGQGVAHSEQLLIPSTLDRRTAMEKFVAPGAVGFWDLPATIRAANLAGYSAAAYALRLHQLLALPVLLAAMSILAAAFSLRLMRLGDLVGLAAAGVGLGFGIFFLNQFCGALGSTEVIPVTLAAWATPVLALLCGLSLLFWTEDG
jgi:lipopolysaccharide export system permease protein